MESKQLICSCFIILINYLIDGHPMTRRCGKGIDVVSSTGVRTEKSHNSRIQANNLQPRLTQSSSLSFSFRSSASNGLLFLASRKHDTSNAVEVHLQDGHIRFVLDCDKVTRDVTHSGAKYDDSQWHQLHFEMGNGNPVLKVDNTALFRPFSLTCPTFDTLFLGGLSGRHLSRLNRNMGMDAANRKLKLEKHKRHGHRLEGCFKNLSINRDEISSQIDYHKVSNC